MHLIQRHKSKPEDIVQAHESAKQAVDVISSLTPNFPPRPKIVDPTATETQGTFSRGMKIVLAGLIGADPSMPILLNSRGDAAYPAPKTAPFAIVDEDGQPLQLKVLQRRS